MHLGREGRRIRQFVGREIAGNRREFIQFSRGGEDHDIVKIFLDPLARVI